EVLTCPAFQFADFLLRWQHVEPSTRRGEAQGLAEVLDRLQGLPLPGGLWEETVLPARVPGYQSRWLDEWVAGGAGVGVGRGGESGIGVRAFLGGETLAQLAGPRPALTQPGSQGALDEAAERVREALGQRGASFVTDLALDTGLTPGAVRAALWAL